MSTARNIIKSYSRTKMLILVIITVVALVLETTVARLYGFFSSGLETLQLNLFLFAGSIILFSSVHFFMLVDIKKKTETLTLTRSKKLRFSFVISTTIQSILCILLFVVLFQTLFMTSYSTNLIIISVCISYLSGIVNLSLLLERFIRWITNVRSTISLLFTFSTFGIILNSVFTLMFVVNVLSTQPPIITLHQGSTVPIILGLNSLLERLYSVSQNISYLLAWLSSVAVMYNYSKKLGKIFWLLAFLPLLYLLVEIQPIIMHLFDDYRARDPSTFIIVYNIFFSLTKLAGAIFFGIGLWSIGRKIQNEGIKSFLSLSGYGLILVFISNQAILLLSYLFPPLGLTTICFLGLSSFLLLAGTYSAALSVANDMDIRKSIRSSVEQEFKLIDKIGEAEMHINIKNRVFSKMKDLSSKLKEETGIESSLTADEIKDYTTSAIEEVRRSKSRK